MRITAQVILAAVGAATLLAAASGASADTRWQRHHPWREQVNGRLARQNHRITQERREGEITRGQAHELRAEDRGIRAQERFDASHNRGHLTRAEHRRINREENQVSGQIGH
ncbi:MAG TPA: hypothetical protein VIC25_01695 [Caulobacteraceae bacterium]|jgi:hypothetical protein